MSIFHNPLRVGLCLLAIIAGLAVSPANAQGQGVTLVGRSVLPATIMADGPKAGKAWNRPINGIKLPFDSQPVGSVSAILPGGYANAWLALSDSQFDSAQHSNDYLLRIYTVNLSWHDANGGDGSANVADWLTLSDPASKVGKKIQNDGDQARELTGADFDPLAFGRGADGSFWIAVKNGPALLHFDARGHLLSAPIALGGAGELQGMGELPDRKTLAVAQRAQSNNASIVVRKFDMGSGALGDQIGAFNLSAGASSAAGLTMINDHQALVIEQDGKQNKASQFKQVFLVDLSSGAQTPLVDLLNIGDPSNISTANVFQPAQGAFGLGAVFKFPFTDISAVYPLDQQTLVVVNNNHVPFGLGRSTLQADDSEYVAVRIGQPLTLNAAFAAPH